MIFSPLDKCPHSFFRDGCFMNALPEVKCFCFLYGFCLVCLDTLILLPDICTIVVFVLAVKFFGYFDDFFTFESPV